jgi:membrane-bound metal-dependent hydrolase YbcI (DUF457 family)
MNKREHVLNAVLLSVGLGFVLHPTVDEATARAVAELVVPVVLGVLFPDIDTAFGRHRKTLHNVFVLGGFFAYPMVFDNLHFVWVGVFSHYVLDLVGSKRGLALFYPLEREYSLPTGVPVRSRWATLVTVVVTIFEVGVAAVAYSDLPLRAVEYGRGVLGG